MGLTLGDFLWVVAQLIQFGADGFRGRQSRRRVAFLSNQLAPHLGRGQAGIQAGGAELWVSLALAVDDGLYIRTLIGSRALAAYGDVDGPSAANNRP